MKLSEYFEQAKGIGVLATTDAAGQVNQAIYAKPLFLEKDDDGTCSFVMANRLTHDNVKHDPSASYLFIEQGEGYVGKRLSLTVLVRRYREEMGAVIGDPVRIRRNFLNMIDRLFPDKALRVEKEIE